MFKNTRGNHSSGADIAASLKPGRMGSYCKFGVLQMGEAHLKVLGLSIYVNFWFSVYWQYENNAFPYYFDVP